MTVITPICRIHCNILAAICSSELYSAYKHDNRSVSLSDNDFERLVHLSQQHGRDNKMPTIF